MCLATCAYKIREMSAAAAVMASEDVDIELTADDDVLDAARTLGALRNDHSGASKTPVLDRTGAADAGAMYDDGDRFRAYTSTTSGAVIIPHFIYFCST